MHAYYNPNEVAPKMPTYTKKFRPSPTPIATYNPILNKYDNAESERRLREQEERQAARLERARTQRAKLRADHPRIIAQGADTLTPRQSPSALPISKIETMRGNQATIKKMKDIKFRYDPVRGDYADEEVQRQNAMTESIRRERQVRQAMSRERRYNFLNHTYKDGTPVTPRQERKSPTKMTVTTDSRGVSRALQTADPVQGVDVDPSIEMRTLGKRSVAGRARYDSMGAILAFDANVSADMSHNYSSQGGSAAVDPLARSGFRNAGSTGYNIIAHDDTNVDVRFSGKKHVASTVRSGASYNIITGQ